MFVRRIREMAIRSGRVYALALASAIGLLGVAMDANAQAMTDIVTLTIGGNGSGPIGAGFRADVGYGEVSPAVTSNGYSYYGIYDNSGVCTLRACGSGGATFKINGLSADPGQSWLTSVATLGTTLTGSTAASYSYQNGIASWGWTTNNWGLSTTSATTVQVSVTHGAPPLGYLDLKYQILGVDYAPPGSKSTVNYGSSEMRGTAASSSNSFKTGISVTVTGDLGVNLFGIVSGGLTASTDTSYTQTTGNTTSDSLQNTTTNNTIIPGPASSTAGLDHDYDVIWVWLNPVASAYVGNNTVSFAGYGYNAQDDYFGMEVVPIQVIELKNPSLMSAGLQQRLARTWDTSGVGGLTTADYFNILTVDPFATNAAYDPLTANDNRFQPVTGSTIPYVPAAPGGLPSTVSNTISTQATTSSSQNASTEYGVTFTLLFSSQIDYIAEFAEKLQITNTYTVTDTWSSTINSATGKTASYSVTGPASGDNYTGPVSFQVYRDNVYGSFMFYPL